MTRMILTDVQWSRIEPHCLGKASDPGRTGGDARLFIEAVLWIARTGSPWRDLPEVFGNWNTVFKRFRHWVKADVFKRIFDALSGDPDLEFAMVDGTIVKVHRHGQGAKGGLRARPSASPEGAGPPDPRADRRARQPGALRAAPRAAPRHGGRRAAHRGCRLRRVDRRQGLRRQLDRPRGRCARRAGGGLPASAAREAPTDRRDLSQWRHLMENFFCKLKEFKRIARRACKTDASFAAMIYAAATILNTR